MALGESHGYESADSKRYMRQSVMISDLIGVFASAYFYHIRAQETMPESLMSCWTAAVLVPALLACRRVFCRGSAEKGDLMLLGHLCSLRCC